MRGFDGKFDGQRFRCAGDMARVMAETYLLFDGFDVAVRDWRCRSLHPKRPSPNSQSRTARSWRGLRQARPGRARDDIGVVKLSSTERGRERRARMMRRSQIDKIVLSSSVELPLFTAPSRASKAIYLSITKYASFLGFRLTAERGIRIIGSTRRPPACLLQPSCRRAVLQNPDCS